MIGLTKDIRVANAITHNGRFHADDVIATVLLSKFMKNLKVMRVETVPTRLKKNAIVYDIGLGRFDHHQTDGNGKRPNGVSYATAGLVWKEFGHQILLRKYGCEKEYLERVFRRIDRELIQGVDAVDNGQYQKSDYPAQPMNISTIVSNFNPEWDSGENEDIAFLEAVNFVRVVFDKTVKNILSKTRAIKPVEEKIRETEGHVMILEKDMPWQDAIKFSLEPSAKDIWFVVYPSRRGKYKWRSVLDREGGMAKKEIPANVFMTKLEAYIKSKFAKLVVR